MSVYGGTLWGDSPIGGTAAAVESLGTLSPFKKWRIELYDSSDNLVSMLPNAVSVSQTVRVSQPPSLTFSYSLEYAESANFDNDHYVLLRNLWGVAWQRHRIVRTRKIVNERGAWVQVDCEGLLGQLSEQIVLDYRAENRAAGDILSDLFALQTWADRIEIGYIAPVFASQTATVSWQKRSILECVQDLVRQFGGFVACGADRLYWLTNIESTPYGRRIEVGKDMLDLEIETDYTDVCTRLYAYGAGGADGAEVNLQRHAAQTYQFIDADNIDSNAPRARIVTKSNIADGATLLAYAQTVLARKKVPATRYRTSAIDIQLSQIGEEDYQHFTVGRKLHVVCAPLALEFTASIAELSQSFDDPSKVRIVLADPNDVNRESSYDKERISETLAPFVDIEYGSSASSGGIGGGTNEGAAYVADDVDDLPNTAIPENAIARVTDSATESVVTYQRNVDNTLWEPISQWLPYSGT